MGKAQLFHEFQGAGGLCSQALQQGLDLIADLIADLVGRARLT